MSFAVRSPGHHVIEVEVSGKRLAVPADRSLLASLLVNRQPGVEFYCAIGQCLRCELVIDGRPIRSCLYYPRGGEVIEGRREGPSTIDPVR